MGATTAIEWADASWTPIRARAWEIQDDGGGRERLGWHCEHVSEGCRNCYAEALNRRLGTGYDFKPGVLTRHPEHERDVALFLDETMLMAPLRWRKPRRIFVCSMTDLFADFVPDAMIDSLFAVMALAPQHTFQVLTKRAERMRDYFANLGRAACLAAAANALTHRMAGLTEHNVILSRGLLPLPNVWLGVSAERQQEWDERKVHLRDTPAAVRFASFEPLLGPIVEPGPIGEYIDWAIVGGESGRDARPMQEVWAESLRDQCRDAGVAFFMKQMARRAPIPDHLMIREFPA